MRILSGLSLSRFHHEGIELRDDLFIDHLDHPAIRFYPMMRSDFESFGQKLVVETKQPIEIVLKYDHAGALETGHIFAAYHLIFAERIFTTGNYGIVPTT